MEGPELSKERAVLCCAVLRCAVLRCAVLCCSSSAPPGCSSLCAHRSAVPTLNTAAPLPAEPQEQNEVWRSGPGQRLRAPSARRIIQAGFSRQLHRQRSTKQKRMQKSPWLQRPVLLSQPGVQGGVPYSPSTVPSSDGTMQVRDARSPAPGRDAGRHLIASTTSRALSKKHSAWGRLFRGGSPPPQPWYRTQSCEPQRSGWETTCWECITCWELTHKAARTPRPGSS